MFLPFTVATIRCLKRGFPYKKMQKIWWPGGLLGPGVRDHHPGASCLSWLSLHILEREPIGSVSFTIRIRLGSFVEVFCCEPMAFQRPVFIKAESPGKAPLFRKAPDGKGDSDSAYFALRKDSAKAKESFFVGKTFEISKQQTNWFWHPMISKVQPAIKNRVGRPWRHLLPNWGKTINCFKWLWLEVWVPEKSQD